MTGRHQELVAPRRELLAAEHDQWREGAAGWGGAVLVRRGAAGRPARHLLPHGRQSVHAIPDLCDGPLHRRRLARDQYMWIDDLCHPDGQAMIRPRHTDSPETCGSRRNRRASACLLALSGCAEGEVKAGLGPNENPVTSVVVSAGQSSISVGQAVILHAEGRTASGQPAPVEVVWSASGGSVVTLSDSVASFSAAAAGSYVVRATSVTPSGLLDSTTITVVAATSPTVSLALAPGSASLATGGVQPFSVVATRQDGPPTSPASPGARPAGQSPPAASIPPVPRRAPSESSRPCRAARWPTRPPSR